MGELKAEPKLTLRGKQGLLSYLNSHPDRNTIDWETTSDFIEGVIDQIAKSEFPYNATVQREVERQLGLPQQPDNGCSLSKLVYNAQGYRHSAIYKREGFEVLTQELADRAYAQGAKVEIEGHNILLSPVRVLYNVRKIGNRVYVMKPRARNHAVSLSGQLARIVKA